MWCLVGFDTFEDEYYSISTHRSELAARTAAKLKMGEIEKLQPTESSGGQGDLGIQDRLFIEDPTGKRVRYI